MSGSIVFKNAFVYQIYLCPGIGLGSQLVTGYTYEWKKEQKIAKSLFPLQKTEACTWADGALSLICRVRASGGSAHIIKPVVGMRSWVRPGLPAVSLISCHENKRQAELNLVLIFVLFCFWIFFCINNKIYAFLHYSCQKMEIRSLNCQGGL